MNIAYEDVKYTKVAPPELEPASVPVDLQDETMIEHKEKVLARMLDAGLNTLVIYADREHGTNFGYLTGFEPRFEESVLVLHQDGQAYIMLGNESLRMAQYCRITAQAIHVPHFSLPNQPMETDKPFAELLAASGIQSGSSVGVVGWKMFTSALEDNEQLYDVPFFIVDAVRRLVGGLGFVKNATELFIHPDRGARVINNANEIAHYEFGASLASACVLNALNTIEPGRTELEIADKLAAYGQPVNVQTICATGERFTNAVVAPRHKKVALGDRFSMTMGMRGGLTSRSGYVAAKESELPDGLQDYLHQVAIPYYAAAATWYSTVRAGLPAGELYERIEGVLPKEKFGWKLNPGHLTSGEEWMSSPVFKNSSIELMSGMLLQMDIIPHVPGYGGANAEDGIALADQPLRQQLEAEYPEVWARICERRRYMQDTLGIRLHPDVLPLSNLCGYMRPLLLDRTRAFKLNK
ncbi:M24 family metallopeptidase [Paenibacillus sanguinis]|uniref:M24 family metallopeptidase n=1 Tax=Paenibacillus sanguinis TaxID=225906 RepID=UPI000371529D|nr:M24 family metallopeptidase [Paenibacillus sanguinis]